MPCGNAGIAPSHDRLFDALKDAAVASTARVLWSPVLAKPSIVWQVEVTSNF